MVYRQPGTMSLGRLRGWTWDLERGRNMCCKVWGDFIRAASLNCSPIVLCGCNIWCCRSLVRLTGHHKAWCDRSQGSNSSLDAHDEVGKDVRGKRWRNSFNCIVVNVGQMSAGCFLCLCRRSNFYPRLAQTFSDPPQPQFPKAERSAR